MRKNLHTGGRGGTTIIELHLVMVIILVALYILSGTILASSRQRTINRENAIASEAARIVLEDMRAEPFDLLWALYNPDPSDDPLGEGTAPGARFRVEGLDPRPDSIDGTIGRVRFPSRNTGTLDAPVWELREDVDDRRLGMPRDLSGDLVIDELGHGDDYFRLPVEIQLEWAGELGDRRLTIATMLCEFDFGG